MNLLAIDPGGRTGFVHYVNSQPVKVGEVEFDGAGLEDSIFQWMMEWKDVPLDVIVYEDYIIRPMGKGGMGNYGHQWNKGEALQVIGAARALAALQHIPVVRQQPSIKPVAAKRCNLPYDSKKSGRGTHQMDAMLHGNWFLLNNAS